MRRRWAVKPKRGKPLADLLQRYLDDGIKEVRLEAVEDEEGRLGFRVIFASRERATLEALREELRKGNVR